MARYDDDEVEEILRRALQRQAEEQRGTSHEELVAAAREVGLDPAAVDAAIAELRAGKDPARVEPDPDDELLDRDRRAKRASFVRHLSVYALVCAFLAAINVMAGGGPWVLWVVLGWGLGVGLQGLRLVLPAP